MRSIMACDNNPGGSEVVAVDISYRIVSYRIVSYVYIMYNILKYKIVPIKNQNSITTSQHHITNGYSQLFCARAKKIPRGH